MEMVHRPITLQACPFPTRKDCCQNTLCAARAARDAVAAAARQLSPAR